MTTDPRLIETILEDLAAEQGYADMLARPETVVDAFDLFDSVPTCSSCQKPDNSVGDLGSGGLCATCASVDVGDPDITVDGNTVTLHRPAAGWRSLEELLRAHPEAFVTLGDRGDDVEYGPVCQFCGNRAAVCRCDR